MNFFVNISFKALILNARQSKYQIVILRPLFERSPNYLKIEVILKYIFRTKVLIKSLYL